MKGETMNDATLAGFRQLADTMLGDNRNWQWRGNHLSQNMLGITQERAENYAAHYGGTASKMDEGDAPTLRAQVAAETARRKHNDRPFGKLTAHDAEHQRAVDKMHAWLSGVITGPKQLSLF